MGLLDGTAGLVFRIDADSTGFQNEVRGVDAAVGNLSTKFGSFAGIASVAAAGIVAVTSAAITGATAILNLTNSVAEYGSMLYDAKAKTDLSAATLGTLQLNADKAGSSFEEVIKSVSKFTVLLGQAQQGNETANETLAKYNVTARDTETALDQAITTIAAMETTELRAAAARELFKDKSLSLLPIIEQLNGSLSEATKETIRTGKAMTEEGIKAADDYGDALTDLKASVAAAGRQFATELLPTITSAMQYISAAFVANQGVVSAWGKGFADVLRGVAVYTNATASGIVTGLSAIGRAFGVNQGAASSWADTLVSEFGKVIAHGGLLLYILGKIGAANPDPGQMGPPNMDVPVMPAMPAMPKIGGGGRGGGGGGGATQSAFERAKAANQETIETIRQAVAEALAENDRLYAEAERNEKDFFQTKQDLNLFELQEETRLTEELLAIRSLSAKDRARVEHDLEILRSKIREKENQNAEEDAKQREKESDEEIDRIKKEGDARRQAIRELAQARREARAERIRLDAIEKADKDESRDRNTRNRNEGNLSVLGDSVLSVRNDVGTLTGIISPIIPVLQLGKDLLSSFAQGVGNVVQNLVLLGTAGPNAMRKVVASVLASVAAQAAVLAIMETAYGIAALTPWGAAIYGPAIAHFKAAALFASVAVVSGLAGRGIAGNAFSGDSGGGGGSGSGSDGNGNRPGLQFTEKFQGFLTAQQERADGLMAKVTERTNAVLGEVSNALNRFNETFGVTTPDAVVMAGAGGASGAIFEAHMSELESDGGKSTRQKRAMGDF